MADYYRKLSFSMVMYDLDAWWLQRLHNTVCDHSPFDADRGDGSHRFFEDIAEHVAALLLTLKHGPAKGVELSFEMDQPPYQGKLSVCGEKNANGAYVARLIQAYLQYKKSDIPVGFEWSDSCSEPLDHSYGGGACVVTRDATYFMSTTRWMLDKLDELRATKEPPESAP